MLNGNVAFGKKDVAIAGQVESVVEGETNEVDVQKSIDGTSAKQVDGSLPSVRS